MKKKMNKMLSVVVTICMLLCSLNLMVAHAETAQIGVMYGTTLEVNSTGSQKLSTLNTQDNNTGADSAVFFVDNTEKNTEDYIELNLYYVSDVEKLVFRSRGNLQRMVTAKITYLDENDGKWKTAYESTEVSTITDSADLVNMEVSLNNVKTSRIRIYPLTTSNTYGQIRLDALQVYGTATEARMNGNLLYDSTITSTDAEKKSLWGSNDGKFKYEGGACPIKLNAEGENSVTYTFADAKTIDNMEITHFYNSQGMKKAHIEAYDSEQNAWYKVCDVDMTQEFKTTDNGSGNTFLRENVEFPYPVTTTAIKIVVDEVNENQTHVSFSEVRAGVVERTKLGCLYFTTYDLANIGGGGNMLSKLSDTEEKFNLSKGEAYTDANGNTVNYGDHIDSIFLVNPQKKAALSGEDYVEMYLNKPAEVKQVIIKTVDIVNEDDVTVQKPQSVRVDYLDHDTQEWVEGECLAIPANECTTAYNFEKSVYADSLRFYVEAIGGDNEHIRLAGLYAMGVETDEARNNGNILYNSATAPQSKPDWKEHTALNDGRVDSATYWANSIPSGFYLTISDWRTSEINRIELIYPYAAQAAKSLKVKYYQQEAVGEYTAAWYELGTYTFDTTDTNEQTGGNQWNPVRHVINLPRTLTKASYIDIYDLEGGTENFRISEIIVRKADNTGYTISDVATQNDGSAYTMTTNMAEYDGEGHKYNVYYAAYNESGDLVGVTVNPVNLKPFSTRTVQDTIDLSKETGNITFKRFIWKTDLSPETSDLQSQTITLN